LSFPKASVASDESQSTAISETSSTAGDGATRARLKVFKKKLQNKEKEVADLEAAVANSNRQLEVKNRVIEERDSVVKVSVQKY
jgi:hypothetical protein